DAQPPVRPFTVQTTRGRRLAIRLQSDASPRNRFDSTSVPKLIQCVTMDRRVPYAQTVDAMVPGIESQQDARFAASTERTHQRRRYANGHGTRPWSLVLHSSTG